MPVTLTYFPVPGRGFPIRVCLGAAGVEYEDKHINYQQLVDGRGPEGASDEYPLGSVPVLKLESGVTYCQSGALLRYAGKKCGMYPKDDDDLCLAIDEAVETCGEMMTKAPQSKDQDEKKRLREEFRDGPMKKMCGLLSKRCKGPFYTGERMSIADLVIFGICDTVATGNFDFVETDYITKNWPNLGELTKAVKEEHLVQDYGGLKKD